MERQFVATELVEQSTTGCASNPQAGRPSNHQIFIDVVNHDDQLAAGPQTELPLGAGVDERNSVERFIEAEGNRDETSGFPPVASTPEPPTAAILSISAIVLLYLLFGRQKKQRLYRRS
ncbi:MAG TPA: hypothetical protein DEB39_10995 [Planctomycetaceae bacterium]|nr:hypothetical protein [Planctomycetaceae bacterium]